jgi:hypothetical protein
VREVYLKVCLVLRNVTTVQIVILFIETQTEQMKKPRILSMSVGFLKWEFKRPGNLIW